jgi:hypothetical protein
MVAREDMRNLFQRIFRLLVAQENAAIFGSDHEFGGLKIFVRVWRDIKNIIETYHRALKFQDCSTDNIAIFLLFKG